MAYKPEHAVVWTEIPVTDMTRAVRFYNEAMDFDLSIDESGPNPVAMISTKGPEGVAGHLYPGKPGAGTGPTIHFGVPGKLEDSVAKWAAAGGAILSDPIEIPPGRFSYVEDMDGNSIGLFEPKRA